MVNLDKIEYLFILRLSTGMQNGDEAAGRKLKQKYGNNHKIYLNGKLCKTKFIIKTVV